MQEAVVRSLAVSEQQKQNAGVFSWLVWVLASSEQRQTNWLAQNQCHMLGGTVYLWSSVVSL